MSEADKKTSPFSQNVRAVTRALIVLNSFADKGLQSLADVSNATGLDKGTTRRLLLTLMQSDYIAQDPATHRYKLGRAIRDLAASVEVAQDLRTIVQPLLLELAHDLGVTAFLSVYEDGAAVCLDRVHDMRGFEVHWWAIGGTLPLNCGAAPKLLLAYRPDEEIERFLASPLSSMSPQSITDPRTLRQTLADIRARGWECAIDDVAVGITAVAVPILGEDGLPICVISMAGLTPQHVADGQPVYLERLRQVATEVRQRLGLPAPQETARRD